MPQTPTLLLLLLRLVLLLLLLLFHLRAQMLQKLVVRETALAAIVQQMFDEEGPCRTRVAVSRNKVENPIESTL